MQFLYIFPIMTEAHYYGYENESYVLFQEG